MEEEDEYCAVQIHPLRGDEEVGWFRWTLYMWTGKLVSSACVCALYECMTIDHWWYFWW